MLEYIIENFQAAESDQISFDINRVFLFEIKSNIYRNENG